LCLTRSRGARASLQTGRAKKVGEGRLSTTVKVKVDRDRCQGHARCAALAPELFKLDELGNAQEIGDGTVPEALIEKAYLAKANCPELAIEVTET
jgi:ferredoxin